MGMIYRRGEVFWIKYYSGGRPIRESARTTIQDAARKMADGHISWHSPHSPLDSAVVSR